MSNYKLYKGKVVCVISENIKFGDCEKGSLCLREDGTEFVTDSKNLKDIAFEKFSIGDKVKGKVCFEGTVVGFEYGNNKVICKSLRAKDGVRYAYDAEDLEKVEDTVTFKIGSKYVINGYLVKACEHPFSDHTVNFYHENGSCFKYMIPKKVLKSHLKEYDIEMLEL